MRIAQAILGMLIAALVFAAVGSLVYGAAVFLLAQHDGSVFRALQAGDFLAAFRDWSGHAQNHPRNSAAVMSALPVWRLRSPSPFSPLAARRAVPPFKPMAACPWAGFSKAMRCFWAAPAACRSNGRAGIMTR